jgi:lipopolysaccharide transport system ATP-binding protein
MSSEIVIKVEHLSKCYQIYDHPHDRLKQFILPHLRGMACQSSKQYFREFWALKDVSFEIKKGETVGIIGVNGSGKSTLLKMICGILNPSRGTIQTKGRIAALLELGSGFNPEFTGRENVYMNAAVLGLTKAEIDQRFEDIAVFADIGEFIEQPVKNYSSGMLMRLAFSVIAHVEADLLVIDEALAVGDIFFSSKCIGFLKKFAQTGTVLFVSHDVNTVLNLCDRAILLKEGVLRADGLPKQVTEIYHAASLKKLEKISGHTPPIDDLDIIDVAQLNALSGFRKDAKYSGGELAKILSVYFMVDGRVTRTLLANSNVEIHIWIEANEAVNMPITGFTAKTRQGQTVFELNTCSLSFQYEGSTGYRAHTIIKFLMPYLKTSQYLLDVAIANGTQNEHTPLQWTYGCLAFNVLNGNKSNGFISISPNDVIFEVI